MKNPNIIYLDDLQEITGEDTPVKVINRLKADGIKVFNITGKKPYTTLQLINLAGGLDGEKETSRDVLSPPATHRK